MTLLKMLPFFKANLLKKWTDDNNMKLNDVKFELLRYGKKQEIKSQTSYTSLPGVEIESKDDVN